MRVCWIALLLAALGLAAWILVGPAGLLPPGLGDEIKQVEGRPAPLEGVPASRPAEQDADPRRSLEPMTPAEPEVDYLPQPEDGWLVEVVRAKDEAEGETLPVPFASVCFLCSSRVEDYHGFQAAKQRWFGLDLEGLPVDDSYLDYGSCYRADAQGRVRVPVALDDGPTVIGWHAELWGRAVLPADGTPPFRLLLEPDLGLRVHVVDAEGRPQAGVPVSLSHSRQDGFIGQAPCVETRGPEGLAQFRRVRSLVKRWARWTKEERLFVQVALPFASPVVQALDPARLPAEPVRLVLPPTGSVTVEVAGTEELPPGARIAVKLLPTDYAKTGKFHMLFPTGYEPEVVAGVARIPRVGLGLEFLVSVRRDFPGLGWLAQPQDQTGPGPAVAGQEVRFSFPAVPSAPLVEGRAVDGQRRPLGLRVLDLSFLLDPPARDESPWTSPKQHRTDPDGRFLVALHGEYPRGCRAVLRAATRPGLPGPALEGSLELLNPLEPGRIGAGELVLLPARLLIAGSVVDEEGRPVPGASVSLHRPDSPDSADSYRYSSGYLQLHAKTDFEGKFAFHHALDLEQVRLWVTKGELLPVTAIAPTGSSDVRLVLRRECALEGKLLLPEGEWKGSLDLGIRYSDRPGMEAPPFWPPTDGTLRIGNLEPGLVTLEILLAFSRDLVLAMPGLLLEPGKTCRDPRLENLDLRDRLQAIELEIVEENGSEVASGRVLRESDGRPLAFIHEGRARFLALADLRSMRIVTGEHEEVRLRAVPGRRRVVLRPGLEVLLEATPAPGPLGEGISLAALLEVGFTRLKLADSEGRIRTKLPGPGTYRVIWVLRTRDGKTAYMSGRESSEIVVAPGKQVIAVPLDLEFMRGALETLKGM